MSAALDFGCPATDNVIVLRLALTLWFTATTFFGPGVCCCSFAASVQPGTPEKVRPTPTTKPVKACCHREAPPCDDRPKPEPGKKCPCEPGKQARSLPAAESARVDVATHLMWLATLADGMPAPFAFTLVTVTSRSDPSPSPARLAGRDLLAARSLLRC